MMKQYELHQHKQINTIKELMLYCTENYNEKIAFGYQKGKKDIEISYIQFQKEVEQLGTYLFANGFKDCHIAVFGENSYEWILSYFAVVCGGNIIVPIDKELNVESILELLENSECKALFYSDTYSDIINNISLKNVRFFNMNDIPEMLKQGNEQIKKGNKEFLDFVVEKDTLASIVYTSGTTGKSKGVMLTHYNFCADMYGACCNVLLSGPSLLVLPLHHTFGLVASVFAVMFYGFPIYINKSFRRLPNDFQKYKPQHLFVVPLIVETLYKNIWNTAKRQRKDKLLKRIVKLSNALLKCKIDLRKIFFKSVISGLGGNLNLIISGGASIDEKYIKAFQSFGITVLNGYGITECGPIVAVNRNKYIVSGSVGLPLCCNEVKISDEGEVLVRGDNVMMGYYHNDVENEKAFGNGWFRTGDIGYLDEYGALHITGRIKNLIILGNGENIPAESIEEKIYTIPYVKEAIVYGKDNVIVTEVYLEEESRAKEQIYQDIKMLNGRLPQIQNIGKIVVRDTEFPKTTTKKIKRNYGGQINA